MRLSFVLSSNFADSLTLHLVQIQSQKTAAQTFLLSNIKGRKFEAACNDSPGLVSKYWLMLTLAM